MKKWLVFACALVCSVGITAGYGIAFADSVQSIDPIEITVSPKTLVLHSEGVWVSVHTDMPYYAVATLSLELNDIEVAWTKSDSRGYLVAKFNLDEVKNIIAPPNAELTLTGTTKAGVAFEGSDIVKVSK